ncbi:Ger(x)C family spore germination protein [Neobacillus mesonae]|uniref:Ger(x)C family spore germination protein n=1 Tax=Neobacillus mesonae TaxID=1193713 RepID=UPI0020418DEA|nr:Ger(x)C family spore germination protein [Neobacillus mesonae]MCM3570971.1 Ger(x)C family spore germination protein [Neobacillus mesonae]
MLRIKVVCEILVIFLMISILTGCWDREELEDRAYVIGIGLDRSEHKGKIQVTMLLANPEVGSVQGGGGSPEKPREIISFDANDIIAAKGTVNSIISRIISYDLLKIIVVSEELARDSRFTSIIYDIINDKEIRMNAYLAVSNEKASEYFLKNKPRMETRPHKYYQYMIHHGIENGLIPDSTLFRFFTTLERGSDLFLAMNTAAKREKSPRYKSEDEYTAGQVEASGEFDDTQFIGSAVFKDGVMVGKINGLETVLANVLDDSTNIKDLLVDVPNPFPGRRKQIAVRLMKREKNKVKMDLKGERPQIFITIPLRVVLMTNPSKVDFSEKRNQEIIKKAIKTHTENLYEKLLLHTQKEYKEAPYPLSFYARKYFGTIQEFEKFNWAKKYQNAVIHMKSEIKIIDYGKKQSEIDKGEK